MVPPNYVSNFRGDTYVRHKSIPEKGNTRHLQMAYGWSPYTRGQISSQRDQER